ncbi:holin [Microtetraspora malaysiensis]|uniref:Holin n=1 Tax=Microtetraspora malaysiensis TaxID=161358 RepID=A0ABW6T5M5_9ACTN
MKTWMTDAIERAVRASAASALGVIGTSTIGLLDVDWPTTGSVAGLAAVVSLLMSVAAGRAADPETAGFTTRTR